MKRALWGGIALVAAVALSACPSTIDFNEGHRFPCEAKTGTGCSGGWICGIDNFCHPNEPGPYACEFQEDGSGDVACVGGWRCGLEGVCHDRIAAAWQCRTDQQCEESWRCGALKVCVDPSLDQLLADDTLRSYQGGAVSPLVPFAQPLDFAVSPTVWAERGQNRGGGEILGDFLEKSLPLPSGSGMPDPFYDPRAIGYHSRFKVVTVAGRTATGLQLIQRYQDAPFSGGGMEEAFSFFGSLEAGPDAVDDFAVVADRLYVREGELLRRFLFEPKPGGVLELTEMAGPPQTLSGFGPETRFKVLRDRRQRLYWLAIFDRSRLRFVNVLAGGSDFLLPYELVLPDAGIRDVGVDLTSFEVETELGPYSLARESGGGPVGLTDGGFDVQPLSRDGLPHVGCGTSTHEVVRVLEAELGDRALVVKRRGDPSAPEEVSFLHRKELGDQALCPGLGGIEVQVEMAATAPCRPCREDEEVSSLFALPGLDPDNHLRTQFYARCWSEERQRERTTVLAEPTASAQDRCSGGGEEVPPLLASLSDRLYTQTRYGGFPLLAGGHSQLWTFEEMGTRPQPILLDRAPAGLARVQSGPESTVLFAFGEGELFRADPERGFLHQQDGPSFELLTTVSGHPSWLVLSSEKIIDSADRERLNEAVVTFDSSAPTLDAPVNAAMAEQPDGGSTLVVSTFDTLLATDVTEIAADRDVDSPVLQVRLSPSPRNPILSLATVSPRNADGSAVHVRGYTLTPNGLFLFEAPSTRQWISASVPIPDREWVRVWSDGKSGRVGDRTGEVLALPSLVPISIPFTDATQTVWDYRHVCGRSYALTSDQLFWLKRQASGPLGEWRPVLSAARPGNFLGGRILDDGKDLFLFSRNGHAFRVEGGCQ